MYRNDKVIRRYSEPFKLKILAELTIGKHTKSELCKLYSIEPTTVNVWIKKYNRKDLMNTRVKDSKYQVIEFEKKLEFIEGKKAFFEERNNYLDELIGREVGASLFETFKQRKGELEKPVNKWLWIVIAMAILTFGAILTIFTNAFGLLGTVPTDISTTRLITNSIKSLPFFFLLFYAIAQYNKERNFQEEYAFKSAVALTIKAYSDIITNEVLKDKFYLDQTFDNVAHAKRAAKNAINLYNEVRLHLSLDYKTPNMVYKLSA